MKSVNNFTGDIDLTLGSTKKFQLGHSLLEFNPKAEGIAIASMLSLESLCIEEAEFVAAKAERFPCDDDSALGK